MGKKPLHLCRQNSRTKPIGVSHAHIGRACNRFFRFTLTSWCGGSRQVPVQKQRLSLS